MWATTNVDSVYQKVLALANKEQRGYISPQEFNLFANQAQLEIINQYFYELDEYARRRPTDNDYAEYSDMENLIQEKLGILQVVDYAMPSGNAINGFHPFPDDLLRLGSVSKVSGTNLMPEISWADKEKYNRSKLTKLTFKNPAYIVTQSLANNLGYYEKGFQIYPVVSMTGGIEISYIRKPNTVKWGYVVINEKAMYDPGNSIHFDLHPAEESDLIYRILKLCGVAIKRDDIAGAAQQMEAVKTQQEKQ